MPDLEQIVQQAENEIHTITDKQALENVRVQYLGKKGQLTELMKQLSGMPAKERPQFGQAVNIAKQKIQGLIKARLDAFQTQALQTQLSKETVDVTLPGRRQSFGSLHPVTLVKQRVAQIFSEMGFDVCDGPEIESEYYNFSALNIPEYHPARTMNDTFYINDELVLRTHMSPVQIRFMESAKPPLRMIAMGRVYRHDFDLTHTPMFHQMEGLLVDKEVKFSDLKGILINFLNAFFEKDVPIRLRPSYFPFTEPSAEVDIQCTNCGGKGCRSCSHTGWLEVLGSGMVHPNVLKAGGIDSKEYTGFAFGVGLDRLAMLKYQINDLRMFFENDLRFLKQF